MVIEVTNNASIQTSSYCCYGIPWKEQRVYYLVWSLESSLSSLNYSWLHSILYVYCHHSSNHHPEVVLWLIKNTKLNDDTAGYVLQWACG